MTFERQDVELYIPTTRGEAYIEKDRQAEQANYRLMAANGRIKWLERRLERAENTAGWLSFMFAILFIYALIVTTAIWVR